MANDDKEYLMWVCSNLDSLEFRTEQACELRDDIRRWRYAGCDAEEAERLSAAFRRQFSDNPFLDLLTEDVRYMAERTALPMSEATKKLVQDLPVPGVVGTSLKAYGGVGDAWRSKEKMTERLKARARLAKAELGPVLKALRSHVGDEQRWRRARRLSLSTLVIILLFAAATVFGAVTVLPLLWPMFGGEEWRAVLEARPIALLVEPTVLLGMCGFLLLCIVVLLMRGDAIGRSVWACLVWLFGYRKSLRRREVFLARAEGYLESAGTTATEKLAALSGGMKADGGDPSREYFAPETKARTIYRNVRWRDTGAAGRWNKLYTFLMSRHVVLYRLAYLLAAALALGFALLLRADYDSLRDEINKKMEKEHRQYVESVTVDLYNNTYDAGYLTRPELRAYESSEPYGTEAITYIPEFAVDGNRDTAWGAAWEDEPVWLEYSFPKTQFYGMCLANGNQFNQGENYFACHRARRVCMDVYCYGELVRSFEVELADETSWQYLILSGPLEATSVRLTILSTYSGDAAVFLSEATPLAG